jgi:RNA 2',3'-cyclic 3'-phosphodiesterase
MEIRSFLAFELPEGIKKTVARVSGEIRHTGLDARWMKPENIHLTVVFMGNIKADDIGHLGGEAGNVCSVYGTFDIAIKGMGCFPNRQRPRVLWMGLDGNLGRMSRFRDDLQKSLKAFGIKEERRGFKPHLTLARFRSTRKIGSKLEEILKVYDALESPYESLIELHLFKSELKPEGAVYTKLKSWPLSGGM